MISTNAFSKLKPEPWQLQYLFKIGRKSWLIHVFVVTLVYVVLRGQGDFFFYWFAIMASTSLIMSMLCRIGSSLSPDDNASRLLRFGVVHTCITIIIGILWGAGAMVATQLAPELALFYSLALGGTMLAAVSSQSSVLRSTLCSIWSSVPPLAFAHWNFSPLDIGPYIGSLMILFGITLTILAYRMHGFLNDNHRLGQNLAQQVETLKVTTHKLDVARRVATDANASKSRFLAHASHDLRQPLHAIGLLNSNMAHEEMSPFARETVRKIGTSVSDMTELFRSLLDFSSLELGQVHPQPSHFNIGDLLQEISARNSEIAKRANSELTLLPSNIWVEADRTLLANILQNLVSNAVKYAPGKPVRLGAEPEGQTITVFVADQGDGIPADEVEAVFAEYYRVNTSKAQKVDGLGLGLALVQRFSIMMGLNCTLTSSKETGTRVEVAGLQIGSPDSADKPRPIRTHHRLTGLRVHIVDDDPEILDATEKLLAKWGCVTSATTAIPTKRLGIDLLIADYDLGDGITGKDCIARMRRLEGLDLPAMILTGLTDLDLKELDIVEPVGLLEKPAAAQKIRSMILSLLTRKQAML